MAKRPRAKAKKTRGPYLAAAVFCEQVLEEKPDEGSKAGMISAIRIFDMITTTIPADIPEGVTPAGRVSGLVVLRTDSAPSTHTVQLVLIRSSGKREKLPETKIAFPGKGQANFNFKFNVAFPVEGEGGQVRFDVLVDGRWMTSIPLKIVIQREQVARSPKAAK